MPYREKIEGIRLSIVRVRCVFSFAFGACGLCVGPQAAAGPNALDDEMC